MSSEHLVHDVEKGGIMVVREQPHKDTHWKCLSLFSFVLLIGATVAFTLLQFGAFSQSGNEENTRSFSEGLPKTLQVQAVASGKPAIHALGELSSDNQLTWTVKATPSMEQNGLKLDESNNFIVIPSTGLYFVYSQLSFHSTSCPENPLLLTHTVSWLSSDLNVEVDLLKAIKTPCEGRDASKSLWFESIYQGAVFKLKKGDRLWSRTDKPEYLDLTRRGQVYFGIIAM
uniref:Tumor necrosis factor n=1 Tax=Salvator merianae TaxID=96440 RepID=A0A8D0C4W2_SALMN